MKWTFLIKITTFAEMPTYKATCCTIWYKIIPETFRERERELELKTESIPIIPLGDMQRLESCTSSCLRTVWSGLGTHRWWLGPVKSPTSTLKAQSQGSPSQSDGALVHTLISSVPDAKRPCLDSPTRQSSAFWECPHVFVSAKNRLVQVSS